MDITYQEDIKKTCEILESDWEKKENTKHIIKRYVHKDGRILWGETNSTKVKLQSGELLDFAIINDINLPLDSIWFRKSNFFTLVVELANGIENVPGDLLKKLQDLESNIVSNKNNSDSEFGKYYSYMYQATHARKARVVRAESFKKHVLGEETT